MRPDLKRKVHFLFSLTMMMGFSASSAFANNTQGNLPWEGPLQTLVTSLTGPVAFAIAVIGIIGAGAALLFGGEMNDLLKRLLQVGIAVCLIVFAVQVLNNWIGFAAEVASALPVKIAVQIA